MIVELRIQYGRWITSWTIWLMKCFLGNGCDLSWFRTWLVLLMINFMSFASIWVHLVGLLVLLVSNWKQASRVLSLFEWNKHQVNSTLLWHRYFHFIFIYKNFYKYLLWKVLHPWSSLLNSSYDLQKHNIFLQYNIRWWRKRGVKSLLVQEICKIITRNA